MTFLPGYDPSAAKATGGRTVTRGLSPKLWRNVRPELAPLGGNFQMFSDWYNWVNITPTTAASTTADTTNNQCTFTNNTDNDGQLIKASSIAGAPGDILALDSEGGADEEGCQAQFQKQGLTPRDGYDIYFEARVALSDIATAPDTFVGLASSDTTVMTAASATPTATDFTGFYTNASTSLLFGNDVDVTATSIHTLLDHATSTVTSEAFVKVGFVLRGTQDGGEYYINGVSQSEVITWAAAANAVMYPSFACLATAAVDSIMYIDWYAIAQWETAGQ